MCVSVMRKSTQHVNQWQLGDVFTLRLLEGTTGIQQKWLTGDDQKGLFSRKKMENRQFNIGKGLDIQMKISLRNLPDICLNLSGFD